MLRPVIVLLGKFAKGIARHRWYLLLGILFLAVLWGGMRSLQKEQLRTRMPPEVDARRSLGQLMAYLPASGESDLELFHRMYRVGNRITGEREHPRVLSAELVLGVEDFHSYGPVPPFMLLTQEYFRVNARWRSTGAEVLQRSGSAFEIFVLPAERATNLDMESFLWLTRDYLGSSAWKHFPVMWTKWPELYHGNRVVLDVSGNRDALPEAEFAAYLKAAQDWFDDSRPLEEINQMLARTDDQVAVANGLMLLKRHSQGEVPSARLESLMTATNSRVAAHAAGEMIAQLQRNPDREFVLARLEELVSSTNRSLVYLAIKELALFKNERAVTAIGRQAGKPGASRFFIARELGRTGQPSAVKYFDKLMLPYGGGNNHDEVQIRLEIVAALAKIPTPESRELLGKMEKDVYVKVSEAATAALKIVSPK